MSPLPNRKSRPLVLALAAIVLLGLGYAGGQAIAGASDSDPSPDPPSPVVATESAEAVVFASPTCGCCGAWVDHMRKNGFEVRVEHRNDLLAVKRELGVTPELSSCHTAVVGGYVVEGHVPADLVRRLLEERPDVAGLAVPGMPVGSPGMEGPRSEPYRVLAFDAEGRTETWAWR